MRPHRNCAQGEGWRGFLNDTEALDLRFEVAVLPGG